MSHPRETKDTFELMNNDEEPPAPGGLGHLQFIDRGRDRWGQPTQPSQENDPWGQTTGTSAKNDPWSDQRTAQAGVSPQVTPGAAPVPAVEIEPRTSTPRTVHFGEINPAFVGDDNKTPVYSSENGRSVISHEHVVQTNQDGLRVVVTSHRQTWRETEKVVKEKDLKILKVFAIISIILFFPTGIPAFYYARLTHTEFHLGFIRGELDTARKMAKRCEKLIILSVMAAFLIAVLTFVIIENKMNQDGESNKFDSTFGRRGP
jgi:hypothetical protein